MGDGRVGIFDIVPVDTVSRNLNQGLGTGVHCGRSER